MKNQMGKYTETLLILLVFPLLLSCATLYTKGSIIDTDHFSVIGPPGDGWYVNIKKDPAIVDFRKASKDETTLIKTLRNWVADKNFWHLSEEQVANHYRDGEEGDMMLRGEMKGLYHLSDVKRGSTMIGDKKIYFMSYRTSDIRHKVVSDAVLYLFFPADFKERHFFYVFVINHSYAQGKLDKGDLTPIIPVIESLKIK
jgi:hypothetical protein